MKATLKQRFKIKHSRANHGVKPKLHKRKPKLKTGVKK